MIQLSLQPEVSFPETEVFGREWRLGCTVEKGSRDDVRDMVLNGHYLHKFPAITPLILVARYQDRAFGTIVFGIPNRELSVRYGGKTWELARLWVDDVAPRNAESWLIGKAVKYVKREYPDVHCLVSYADTGQGHSGAIYKVSNWKYDGQTKKNHNTVIVADGKRYSRLAHVPVGVKHTREPIPPKHRFYYPLKKVVS